MAMLWRVVIGEAAQVCGVDAGVRFKAGDASAVMGVSLGVSRQSKGEDECG